MKICIPLRDPSPSNPKLGNLRSEGRWERQALEACAQNPEVSEVYTFGSAWENATSPKYRGVVDQNSAKNCIVLMQDWNGNIVNGYRFKAAVVNIFSGPWVEQVHEVASARVSYGEKVYFTMGFPIMYRNEVYGDSRWGGEANKAESTSHLEKFLPRENILLLPVPAAPYIDSENRFEKTNLIWAQRLVFMSQMAQSDTLRWSLLALRNNPALTLDILTGWLPNEVKDYVNEQVVYRPNIVDSFWEMDAFSPFADVRDRVRIPLDLHWEQIIQMYKNSKLLTTHGKLYGGPPIEAGMHGIPFVGASNTIGALGDCPNYQFATTEAEACGVLDRLLEDKEFYTLVGSSYRDYVAENYTFDAFNRNLNKILRDRNLL